MLNSVKVLSFSAWLFLLLVPGFALRFPSYIASSMVIQRGKPFDLVGVDAPRTTITARLGTENCEANALDLLTSTALGILLRTNEWSTILFY